MARPIDPAHLDHAIELYLAGQPEQEILTATGVSHTTLHRERARRGIPPRREHTLPLDELTTAYRSGESEYSIANRYGVSRNVVRRRLESAGLTIRTMAQAGRMRASRQSPGQRKAQASAAHDAIRGTSQPLDLLVRRAQAREQRGQIDSPGELAMRAALIERGLNPVPQKAIGKYNVDLAIAPIAVEILGGGWHLTKRHHAIRTPHILDAGWHLVFVWNHEGASALTAGAADYVVAFYEQMRREPPAIGQYRVIAGNGQPLAAGSRNDDQFPLVPPPRGRQ